MTPEQKQIALTALRSGEYQQYHEAVANKNRTAFCCIGVMAIAMGCSSFVNTETAARECGVSNGIGDESSIPLSKAAKKYLKKNGIKHEDHSPYLMGTLIHLNDTAKWDFNQIADFLEIAV